MPYNLLAAIVIAAVIWTQKPDYYNGSYDNPYTVIIAKDWRGGITIAWILSACITHIFYLQSYYWQQHSLLFEHSPSLLFKNNNNIRMINHSAVEPLFCPQQLLLNSPNIIFAPPYFSLRFKLSHSNRKVVRIRVWRIRYRHCH